MYTYKCPSSVACEFIPRLEPILGKATFRVCEGRPSSSAACLYIVYRTGLSVSFPKPTTCEEEYLSHKSPSDRCWCLQPNPHIEFSASLRQIHPTFHNPRGKPLPSRYLPNPLQSRRTRCLFPPPQVSAVRSWRFHGPPVQANNGLCTDPSTLGPENLPGTARCWPSEPRIGRLTCPDISHPPSF